MSFVGAQFPQQVIGGQVVRLQLSQRLRDLGARLSLHRLLWTNGSARAASERPEAGRQVDDMSDARPENFIRGQERLRGSQNRHRRCSA